MPCATGTDWTVRSSRNTGIGFARCSAAISATRWCTTRRSSTLLWPRARNTLFLTLTAVALAWLVAIPLGVWAANRRGRWPDRVIAGATTTLLATPDLLLGLVLLLIAVRTGYFPTGGMVSIGFTDLGAVDKVKDVVAHFFLPVTALTLINLPVLVRHMRASMIDALQSPFMQGGRAMGVPERRLRIRYAWRIAANPMISLLGLSVAALLSASFVVETIMSWPGIGPLLLASVVARDLHVVVAVVTCSTILLISWQPDRRRAPLLGGSASAAAPGHHRRRVKPPCAHRLALWWLALIYCSAVLRWFYRARRSDRPESRLRVRTSDAPSHRRRFRAVAPETIYL